MIGKGSTRPRSGSSAVAGLRVVLEVVGAVRRRGRSTPGRRRASSRRSRSTRRLAKSLRCDGLVHQHREAELARADHEEREDDRERQVGRCGQAATSAIAAKTRPQSTRDREPGAPVRSARSSAWISSRESASRQCAGLRVAGREAATHGGSSRASQRGASRRRRCACRRACALPRTPWRSRKRGPAGAAESVVAAHRRDQRVALGDRHDRLGQQRIEHELADHAPAEQERLDHARASDDELRGAARSRRCRRGTGGSRAQSAATSQRPRARASLAGSSSRSSKTRAPASRPRAWSSCAHAPRRRRAGCRAAPRGPAPARGSRGSASARSRAAQLAVRARAARRRRCARRSSRPSQERSALAEAPPRRDAAVDRRGLRAEPVAPALVALDLARRRAAAPARRARCSRRSRRARRPAPARATGIVPPARVESRSRIRLLAVGAIAPYITRISRFSASLCNVLGRPARRPPELDCPRPRRTP